MTLLDAALATSPPERFYDAENEPPKRRQAGDDIPSGRREGKLLESMDIFSAGCVIAELWLDGDPIFTLSSMFKYRSGEMTLDGVLSRIDDPDVQVGLMVFCEATVFKDPSSVPHS